VVVCCPETLSKGSGDWSAFLDHCRRQGWVARPDALPPPLWAAEGVDPFTGGGARGSSLLSSSEEEEEQGEREGAGGVGRATAAAAAAASSKRGGARGRW
jgi:hypothetical protein